jgi:hypothetical protein
LGTAPLAVPDLKICHQGVHSSPNERPMAFFYALSSGGRAFFVSMEVAATMH